MFAHPNTPIQSSRCKCENSALKQEAFPEFEVNQARAASYTFLASAFRYPDSEALQILSDPTTWHAWLRILRGWKPGFAELAERLCTRVASGSQEIELRSPSMQNAYSDLFGHAVRGVCPPYELEYDRHDIAYQASELADIAGFYQAFGLEPGATEAERVDHASEECEFMAVLAARQAHALESNNVEAQDVLLSAQRQFLTDHLGRWLPAFSSRLSQADPDGFYGLVGRFSQEFIAAECQRLGATCGPQFLELRTADPQRDAAMECGGEESCPGADCGSERGGSEALVQVGFDHS